MEMPHGARTRTPEAIRLRPLVDAALVDGSAVSIITARPDASWLRAALAIGASIDVIGAAWLHRGEWHLWPGIVAIVTRQRPPRDSRTVIVWPEYAKDGAVMWRVQTLRSAVVADEQVYRRPA